MKKTALILLIISFSVSAQYQLTCEYLINPEMIIGHADSCAKFWLPTYDQEYGGFYENVSREGTVTGDTKTMLGQTRTAYGMARAFMLTGDTTYLDYGRGALDFMYQHAWDHTNEGWFNELNRDGSLQPGGDHNDDKWSFMQNYALLGIGAMYEATRGTTDKDFLFMGRNAVDEHLWDSRPGYEGYYNEGGIDWSDPHDKGFTPTMDGITTHLLYMYLLTKEESYKERLLKVADNIIDYLWPSMSLFNYGYPESYDSDWNPNTSDTYVFTGHMLKSAWCAARAWMTDHKNEYVDFSTEILEEVLEKGYDNTYGGNYANFNGATGSMYGTDKEWWQLEQGFTSSIMNYYITGDERWIEFADRTLKFYMDNMVDREYGEVYTSTSRAGNASDNRKAHYWKAGYHSIELAYYVYLYGNLYIHENPVNLYYHIDKTDSNKTLSLYPLAIEDEKLEIKSVTLDGDPYTDFNSAGRKLNIPAGTGGIFKVTFGRAVISSVAGRDIPSDFKIHQNYPNPFNPSTTIRIDITKPAIVRVDVYDINGEKMRTLMNGRVDQGIHYAEWDGRNDQNLPASSGVYLFRCTVDGVSVNKKGIMLK